MEEQKNLDLELFQKLAMNQTNSSLVYNPWYGLGKN